MSLTTILGILALGYGALIEEAVAELKQAQAAPPPPSWR